MTANDVRIHGLEDSRLSQATEASYDLAFNIFAIPSTLQTLRNIFRILQHLNSLQPLDWRYISESLSSL